MEGVKGLWVTGRVPEKTKRSTESKFSRPGTVTVDLRRQGRDVV